MVILMKWLIIAAGILLMAVLAGGIAVRMSHHSPPTGGGMTDCSDTNAPKTITSTELQSFHCILSGLCMRGAHAGTIYTLHAAASPDGVKASAVICHHKEKKTLEFTADDSFLISLAKIIAVHNIACHNGMVKTRAGLPAMYGAKITACYASGEKLHAFHNQHNFLAGDPMNALVTLFLETARKSGKN